MSAAPSRPENRPAHRSGVRSAPGLALLVLTSAMAVGLGACESVRSERRTTVPAAAVDAFTDARAWVRLGGGAERERAREAARLAAALAPDWVAPRRMLDDFLRDELLGLEALALHRRALSLGEERGEVDGMTLYLAGRLEDTAGFRRFEQARLAAPELAWAHHGLAFAEQTRGDLIAARAHQRAALERARDPFERSYFTASLARIEAAAGRVNKAVDLLTARLADPETAPPDWVELAVQTAELELSLVLRPEGRRGYERALQLLRDHPLTELEVLSLVTRLREVSVFDDPGSLELLLALAAQDGPLRDRLRAELLLAQRATPLALGLLSRSEADDGLPPLGGALLRRARFAAGLYADAVSGWVDELPRVVLDDEGVPRSARLAQIVRTVLALPAPEGPQAAAARAAAALGDPGRASAPAPGRRAAALVELGDALVAAGWYPEARAVASELAGHDLEAALDLENRAAAGLALLMDVDRLMRAIDLPEDVARAAGASVLAPRWVERDARNAEPPPVKDDLDAVLAAFAPLVARANEFLGGETNRATLERELVRSPRFSYGFIGSLIHPGPRFSRADEQAGRGARGAAVPGLARILATFGRFGVFGRVVGGGGVDGTVLALVWVEERVGEHLGVPWSGTVAWCEGADVLTRAGRRGASISGAALHEGYWIDLERVRGEWLGWRVLEARLADPVEGPRLALALETRGLLLETPPALEAERRRERRSPDPLLGAGARVRLALLSDRRALASSEPLVSFDEVVRVTAVHEQGHLCDRTRFLPLARHWRRALAFLASCGFSQRRVAERLEYRAQLVALAEAPDPRMPLADILTGVERGGSLTPHAAGYGALLTDLLELLDAELARDPAAWAELDPDRMLAHQLHRLGPGRLRELARELARRAGLTTR